MKFNNSEPVNFLVIVKCMTYNQHSFIEDAMNGFCMQKTDFPYVCVVMDDSSTDGEQDVIKKYVQKSFNPIIDEETDDYVMNYCQCKTNANCYFAVFYLKYNHWTAKKRKEPYYSRWQDNCKYIAICEGDDYWTNENKLQMQVDFLENNHDFAICFHNVKVYKQQEGVFVDDFITKDVESETDGQYLAKYGNYIHTPSVVFRNNERVFKTKDLMGVTYFGDYPLWVLSSQYGKIKKINQIWAVYRYGVGVCSGNKWYNNEYRWLIMLCKLFMAVEVKELKDLIEIQIATKAQTIQHYLALTDSYYGVVNSRSFKLGKFLTAPLRWIKKKIGAIH